MIDSRFFVDVMEEIVSDVRAEYDTSNGLEPYFIFGHPVEIAKRLSLKDQNAVDKFRKFPLIALLTDITESHDLPQLKDYVVNFTAIIVTNTNKNYKSVERYTNVFKPVLYPIYEKLIQKMEESSYIHFKGNVTHNKIDRLFWGAEAVNGNTGLIFNQYLDAIQLNFTNVRIVNNYEAFCND